MTDDPLDELGPVDFVIVEFPAGKANFTGEMADALIALVEAGTIRVIDILILVKAEDGSVEAMELEDLDDLGALGALEAELAEFLAEDDVLHLAAAMDPGSVAGVLGLREPLGRAVRVGGPSFWWPADRQRPHPHPSHHRRPRGGRGTRRRRSMTCRYEEEEWAEWA